MGQRTAIVLQHVNQYPVKWGRKEEKTTRVFYHQWGIGRVLPSQLLSILNGTLSTSPTADYFSKYSCPTGCLDITTEYGRRKILDKVDFDSPEVVGEIISNADNNNGGIFIRVTETEERETIIEYAYMLGGETEGGNYKEFCTFEEWCNENYGKEYIDKKFLKIYKDTLKYFGAIEKVEHKAAEQAA